MRRLVVLLALLALGLVALRTVRRERTVAPREEQAPVEESRAPAAALDAARDEEAAPAIGSTRDAREGFEREPEPVRPLRVRIVDAGDRTTVRDCRVWLEYAGETAGKATELPDGGHEFREAVRPGTEVVVGDHWGWELDSERVELDAVPEQELVFVARALPRGPVRGTLVDDVEGRPLPYRRFHIDGETLVTDARGGFHGTELHPRGTLEFQAGNWGYELGGWNPERDEAVVVPARVGPMLPVRQPNRRKKSRSDSRSSRCAGS